MQRHISDQASHLTIRGLRNRCDRIFQAVPTRKAFHEPENGPCLKLENDLAEFVRERRSQFLPINAEFVQLTARELPHKASVLSDNKASCS